MKSIILMLFLITSEIVLANTFWLQDGAYEFDQTYQEYQQEYKSVNSSDTSYKHIYNTAYDACKAFSDSYRDSNSAASKVLYRSVGGASGYVHGPVSEGGTNWGLSWTSGDYAFSVFNTSGNLYSCVLTFDQTRSEICHDSNLPVGHAINERPWLTSKEYGTNNTRSFQSKLTAKVFIKLYTKAGPDAFMFYDNQFIDPLCSSNSDFYVDGVNKYDFTKMTDGSNNGLNNIKTKYTGKIVMIPDSCGEEQIFNESIGSCVCDNGLKVDPILGCDYKMDCPLNYKYDANLGTCVNNTSYFCSKDYNKANPRCIDLGTTTPDDDSDSDGDGVVDEVKPTNVPDLNSAYGSMCSTSLKCYDSCFVESGPFCDVSQHGILNDGLFYRWFNPLIEEWRYARNLSDICRSFMQTTYDVDFKSIPDLGEYGKTLLDKEYKVWCYPKPNVDNENSDGQYSESPFVINYVYDKNDNNKDRTTWNDGVVIGDENGTTGGDSSCTGDDCPDGGDGSCTGDDCPDGGDGSCTGDDCPDDGDGSCTGDDCPDGGDGSCTGDDCSKTFDGVIASFQDRISKSDILSSMDKVVWPSSDTCADFVFSFDSELLGKSFSINEPIPMCENFDLIKLVMSSLLFIFTGFACFRIIMGA